MARYAGYGADVGVAASLGVPLNLLGATNWTLDVTGDVPDVTGMDSSGARQFLAGLTAWSGSCDGHVDSAEVDFFQTAGPTAPLARPGQQLALGLWILAGGTKKYTGEGICTGFTPKVAVDGAVDWTLSFQGTGALTYPT